jgi:hypothetical protein
MTALASENEALRARWLEGHQDGTSDVNGVPIRAAAPTHHAVGRIPGVAPEGIDARNKEPQERIFAAHSRGHSSFSRGAEISNRVRVLTPVELFAATDQDRHAKTSSATRRACSTCSMWGTSDFLNKPGPNATS